jgi:protein-S-isoprenylcysteine O-methyltransferase Ste14
MSTNAAHSSQNLWGNILKRGMQILFVMLFMIAELLLASGQPGWVWAWIFIAMNLVGVLANSLVMLRYNPETVAERGAGKGMRDWDKIVSGLYAISYYVLTILIAGLDARFAWTAPLAPAVNFAGVVAFALGFALFSWAMITNAYFATIVRIQAERGHAVCTTGPYRIVRHPGYVGAILQSLATPLLLGSLWALLPGVLAGCFIVIRTVLEDRMLCKELEGYLDYARRVRYRLLPGVW